MKRHRPSPPPGHDAPRETGRVISAHGRHYQVRMGDGRLLACFPRGKQSIVACGDVVEVVPANDEQGTIHAIRPRSSLLYRSDLYKQKLIAANVSQVVIVTATTPSFSDELISRCLVGAESQDLKAVIVLNKCDLADGRDAARAQLAPFVAQGYPVLELSALEGAAPLRALLQGHITVLVGQSGMGKSTLINALIPGANAPTREHSEALDAGKHTTTHARLYPVQPVDGTADSALIDSPGMQEFGLHHLSRGELEHAFREFRPLLGACRFNDCRHDREPGCAVQAAVANGTIHPRRLAVFHQLVHEGTHRHY